MDNNEADKMRYALGKDTPEPEGVDISRKGDGLVAEIKFQTPVDETPDLDQALANPHFQQGVDSLNINLNDYEVSKFRSNCWDVTVRTDDGIETRTNYQFFVEWKIRAPGPLYMALERLIDRMPSSKRVKLKAKDREGERMVEVALYDMHLGMLSWAAETGEDYDVSIARKVLADATNQIVARTKKLKPSHYLLPIGNDFLHINDPSGLTPRGNNQLDIDTRLANIIEESQNALVDTIETLASVAPVDIIWIPGNHDPQTSYWLLRVLAAWYRNDERVTVDVSPKPRKFKLFGINLIGFMHGCDVPASRLASLPNLLAEEAADLWTSGQYREIHIGHKHKKAELYFTGTDTYGGVVVRTIPSLVGTDYWHFLKGFANTSKTAQFFVWNKDYGLEGVHDIHVDRSLYVGE